MMQIRNRQQTQLKFPSTPRTNQHNENKVSRVPPPKGGTPFFKPSLTIRTGKQEE